MNSLKLLIQESKNWASLARGRELAEQVADFLHNKLRVNAGVLVYKRHFLVQDEETKLQVYQKWGVNQSDLELLNHIREQDITSNAIHFFTEHWMPVSDISDPLWKGIWKEADVAFIGSWPITVKGQTLGAVILGITHDQMIEDEFISLFTVHFSLLFEMLVLRRIAEDMNRRDPLTGILNRRGFLETLIHHKELEYGEILITGIVDIDNFKDINDSLGHSTGDEILLDVAQTLKQSIGSNGLCARFGGDEFVFLVKTKEVIEVKAEWIQSHFSNKQYAVSIGCALWQAGEEWNSSFQKADTYMYHNKRK